MQVVVTPLVDMALFSPESVTTTVEGGPTVQCIVVSTDLLVTVGLELTVQLLAPSTGPNVGSCATQVLPQPAMMLMATARQKTKVVHATASFRFIADLRSWPFWQVVAFGGRLAFA